MSKRLVGFLRTGRGQLTSIGAAYGGAAMLAILAICLRSAWFGQTVYEKFPDPAKSATADQMRELALALADGKQRGEQLKTLNPAELISVYAVCIDQPAADPQGRLADALWTHQGEQLLERIRRTIVVGNATQRLHALNLLARMDTQDGVEEAYALCQYTVRRAEQNGESQIKQIAIDLRKRFKSHLDEGRVNHGRQ